MEIKNATKFDVTSKACTERDTVIVNAIKERPTQHWNNEKGTQRARPYPVKPQTSERESIPICYLFLESSSTLKLMLMRVKGTWVYSRMAARLDHCHLHGSGFGDVKDARMRGWVVDSSSMLSESH